MGSIQNQFSGQDLTLYAKQDKGCVFVKHTREKIQGPGIPIGILTYSMEGGVV